MDALATRGLIRSQSNNPDDLAFAIDDLRGVDTNDATTAAARWRLGQILVQLGRRDEAIGAFREAIARFGTALTVAPSAQRGCLERFVTEARADLAEAGG